MPYGRGSQDPSRKAASTGGFLEPGDIRDAARATVLASRGLYGLHRPNVNEIRLYSTEIRVVVSDAPRYSPACPR